MDAWQGMTCGDMRVWVFGIVLALQLLGGLYAVDHCTRRLARLPDGTYGFRVKTGEMY